MRYCDFLIITNEYLLAKVESEDLQIFEYKKYYPNKIPEDFVDIFDEKEIFLYVIKSILKEIKRSSWKRFLLKPNLFLFAIDELNFKLRRTMFLDIFMQINYHHSIFYTNIGPVAVVVKDEEGAYTPTVVISVIGNIIELSYCFAGVSIIKKTIKEPLSTQFNDFLITCNKLQDTSLPSCIDAANISKKDYEKLRCIWEEKRNIKIIVVSNNNSFDYLIDREIKYDNKITFAQMIDFFNESLKNTKIK